MAPLWTDIKIKIKPITAQFTCNVTSDGTMFEFDSGRSTTLTQNDFTVVDDYLYFEEYSMNKGGNGIVTIIDSLGNTYTDSQQLYEGGDGLTYEFTLSSTPPVQSNPQISKIQTPDGTIYDIVASNGYTKDEIDELIGNIESLLSEV